MWVRCFGIGICGGFEVVEDNVCDTSLEGRGDVAASSGVGDLKRTNVVSIQREHTEGRGGGNDGMKGRERCEKAQST